MGDNSVNGLYDLYEEQVSNISNGNTRKPKFSRENVKNITNGINFNSYNSALMYQGNGSDCQMIVLTDTDQDNLYMRCPNGVRITTCSRGASEHLRSLVMTDISVLREDGYYMLFLNDQEYYNNEHKFHGYSVRIPNEHLRLIAKKYQITFEELIKRLVEKNYREYYGFTTGDTCEIKEFDRVDFEAESVFKAINKIYQDGLPQIFGNIANKKLNVGLEVEKEETPEITSEMKSEETEEDKINQVVEVELKNLIENTEQFLGIKLTEEQIETLRSKKRIEVRERLSQITDTQEPTELDTMFANTSVNSAPEENRRAFK